MITLEQLHIILPISNIRGWVDVCLESLYRQKDIDKVKVTFIFNGTNAIVKKRILNKYKPSNILDLEDNQGLVKPLNTVLKDINEEWFMIMHNDTILPENFIHDLIHASNKIIERDETVIGFMPITNYSTEGSLIVNQAFFNNYTNFKPCNKSLISANDVNNILTSFYDNEKTGLEALDTYYKDNYRLDDGLFSYTSEIAHYCMLLSKDVYNTLGPFDEDFYPLTFFEKLFLEEVIIAGYSLVSLKNVYVHHNGNTTSDFFGFDYPYICRENEIIYKRKQRERNEKLLKNIVDLALEKSYVNDVVINHNKPKEALFIYLGELTGLLDVIEIVRQFKDQNTNYQTTLICNVDFVEFIENSGAFNTVLGSSHLVTIKTSQIEAEKISKLYTESEIHTNFDYVQDWTLDISNGAPLVN